MDESREPLMFPDAREQSRLGDVYLTPMNFRRNGHVSPTYSDNRAPSTPSYMYSRDSGYNPVPAYNTVRQERKGATAQTLPANDPAWPKQPQQHRKAHDRRSRHAFLNWWQEAASIFVAVAALTALFATLYAYSDKPSPEWPGSISINTIVSLYVVLLKACIVLIIGNGLGQLKWEWFSTGKSKRLHDLVTYDNASRGIFGALALLWRIKLSHALSTIASLLMVLVLATEPFAQQIIHYYDCRVPGQVDEAKVPRTSYYIENDGAHTGALQESITSPVQNAIFGGVFNPSSAPAAQCQTGNCSFPAEYSSIAWCSACADLTDHLVFKNVSKPYPYANSSTYLLHMTTSLPGGLSVTRNSSVFDPPSANVFAVMALSDSSVASGLSSWYSSNLDFVLGKPPFAYDQGLSPIGGTPFPGCVTAAEKRTLWKCEGYGASRCSLYPCIKTFSSSIREGVLTEKIVSNSSNWGSSQDGVMILPALASVDTSCITAEEKKSLQKLGYDLSNGERWLAYNLSDASTPLRRLPQNRTFPQSMINRNCVYAVDLTFANSLAYWLETTFSGKVVGESSESGYDNFVGPQVLLSMYNYGAVTFDSMQKSFDNISVALTNYIRENGPSGFSTSATGIAYSEKTCIAVRWPWLAFPAALVLITLIFLVLLSIQTRPVANHPEIWKTSPLAILYYGLSEADNTDPIHSGGTIRDREDMDAFAEATSARLTNAMGRSPRLEIQGKHGDN